MRRPLTTEERNDVVSAAKDWLHTPWHHAADVKGLKGGVDCGMMLVRVYCDLGLAPLFDPRPYEQFWFLHQTEEKYLKWIERYCERVDVASPGDIQMYRFGRTIAHGAIVIDDELMIHAYAPAGQVEIRERRAPLVRGEYIGLWSPRIDS